MSRQALYAVCVVAFAFPLAGTWLILWPTFDAHRMLPEEIHLFAIAGLALGMSMILAFFPGRDASGH